MSGSRRGPAPPVSNRNWFRPLLTPPLPPRAMDQGASSRYSSASLPRSVSFGLPVDAEASLKQSDAEPNPIIIAVFGKTGTGKTSFIQSVTGVELEVGHGLESSTKEVRAVNWELDGRRIKLIDTPGFDDTVLSDTAILTIIAEWLKDSYDENCLLSGIIYLHRISDPRMDPSSKKSLRMFRSLCGNGNLKNVILATTMWEKTDEVDGKRREDELRNNFWKEMLSNKSVLARISNDPEDGKRLIRQLLDNQPMVLKLQDELSSGISLSATDAGAEIREEMERLRIKLTQEINSAREELHNARRKDKQTQQDLKEEIESLRTQLGEIETQNQKLKDAKLGVIPRNRNPKGMFTKTWKCLFCKRETHRGGKIKCKGCQQEQMNIGY